MKTHKLIVKPTLNKSDIEKVLLHPDIYDTITDDHCPSASDFVLPLTNDYLYIGGYVKGDIIAVMVYHTYKDGDKLHIQVLPEYRKRYAQQFAEQALTFKRTLHLYAEIPSLYKNVLDFAKSFGFEVSEIKVCDYVKNNHKYDTYIMRFKDGICS